MDTRPIGVFDSGLGGLTAVRQLRRLLPGEDIVYFGDTGRVPYGSRGHDVIVRYAQQDIRFLLSQNVKFIMAACGTVSSTYPSAEAAQLPVPYTGVIGAAARAAAAATKNKRIGVIGTAATIRSDSYATQLKDLVPGVQIFARACPLFVPLVENGYVNGDKVTQLMIEEYLTPVRDSGIDTLILGCTHYPLLKKMIGDFVGDSVTLIDPGKLTAIAAATAPAATLMVIRQYKARGPVSEMLLPVVAMDDALGLMLYAIMMAIAPDGFAKQERLFMGSEAGGPVEQIAIETY